MASRASGTPPESSVRLGDLATNLSSLTLTPVTTAPSSRPQRGSRIKGHGKPRKLFSTSLRRESTTHDSAADGSRQPWGLTIPCWVYPLILRGMLMAITCQYRGRTLCTENNQFQTLSLRWVMVIVQDVLVCK